MTTVNSPAGAVVALADAGGAALGAGEAAVATAVAIAGVGSDAGR